MATTFAVPDGRVAMAATTYTGTGVARSVSNAVNTVSFAPDFVWIKDRTTAYSHILFDTIRGAGNYLISNGTLVETTDTNYMSAFTSTGFSVGTSAVSNGNTENYVGWQWKAGGTAVNNTSGTITSSVSANPTAGFSVVTYTGTGVNATVGHGLGVAPSMIIVKNRGGVYAWPVYHKFMATSSPATWYMTLNQTSAASSGANIWVNDPTTTVFTVSGSIAEVNASTNTYVAYCWAPVAGYSAFGSYTGNGSADGPFIYTGFRPRWILIKRTDGVQSWAVWDTARDPINVASLQLYPNLTTADTSYLTLDMLSNGFKSRSATEYNTSAATYIYAAYAENPMKYANAR
jgi:hypothetical protein